MELHVWMRFAVSISVDRARVDYMCMGIDLEELGNGVHYPDW